MGFCASGILGALHSDDDSDDDSDEEEGFKENLPQINLYWFCTAGRWKNNFMKNEESQRLFKDQIFYLFK